MEKRALKHKAATAGRGWAGTTNALLRQWRQPRDRPNSNSDFSLRAVPLTLLILGGKKDHGKLQEIPS
jgi:hypothetical protein